VRGGESRRRHRRRGIVAASPAAPVRLTIVPATRYNKAMDLAICVRNLPARQIAEVGRFAEDHGYAEVFIPDGATGGRSDSEDRLVGRDTTAAFAAMFAQTSSVRGTLGVAATPMHHRLILPVVASTLNELSGGRFSLGLGVSHPEQTARFGISYPEKPLEYMRDWVRDMKDRSARGVAHGGGWAVLVAALGPRMVEVGAVDADGLILNWLTPEAAAASVRTVRELAGSGEPRRVVLYTRLMTADAARADAGSYDALRNYHRNFVAQGLASPEEIALGTTLPRDDLGAAAARLEEYRASGLDAVCLYPSAFDRDDQQALEVLAR
jgi:alkanesulfonate monooxygenase SsuD/methylene tetrahydromethanopterin reductase-like flavin-dependent oxidoreductase (luciferase family)